MKLDVSISVDLYGDHPKVILSDDYEEVKVALDPEEAQNLMYKIQSALNTLNKLKDKG